MQHVRNWRGAYLILTRFFYEENVHAQYIPFINRSGEVLQILIHVLFKEKLLADLQFFLVSPSITDSDTLMQIQPNYYEASHTSINVVGLYEVCNVYIILFTKYN